MRRHILPLFFTVSILGCSSNTPSDGNDDTGGSGGGSSGTMGQGGTNGGSATGGSSGSVTGGASGTDSGGSGGAGPTGGAPTGGSGGSGAVGGTGGSSGGGGWTKTGVCDQRSEAVAMGSSYQGYEEFYIVSEECVDDGRVDDPQTADLLCLIRFDVTRSGAAPAGCEDLEMMPCEWSQEVTYSNPTVMIDVNGACANGEIAWGTAWADQMDGSTESYGYIDMYEGHDSVIMRYSDAMSAWDVLGRASWDPMTGAFSFKNRFGACQY